MPATYDRFFRTDLGMEFFYDGTRWVSVTLYSDPIATPGAISATGLPAYIAQAFPGLRSLWLVSADLTFFVSNGATALDGSNKWVVDLNEQPANVAAASWTIDSGSSGAWRNGTAVTIGAVLGTSNFAYQVSVTKTGTPGALYPLVRMNYRVIAT